jgi:hypothetical protein
VTLSGQHLEMFLHILLNSFNVDSRSGAVEQLRVHVRNLSMLGVNGAGDSKGRVELYERGYGKDAATIARDAIHHGRENDFDVVLIDTAGRMQDNEVRRGPTSILFSITNQYLRVASHARPSEGAQIWVWVLMLHSADYTSFSSYLLTTQTRSSLLAKRS